MRWKRVIYWLLHGLFWCLVLLFSVYIIGHEGQQYEDAWKISLMYFPIVACTAYFIVRYLIPQYLLKDQVGYFALYLIYTFIASIYGCLMVVVSCLSIMVQFKYENLLGPIRSIYTSVGLVHFFIILFVAISVTEQWYTMQYKYALALQEKSQAELKFLKMQLHPHFLFNTLNNLYYLTLHKSDKAPEAVMMLSQLLSYVLYHGKETWVLLQEEFDRLQDFATLEAMRYEDRLQLSIRGDQDFGTVQVPPLLLITLLENSFKHGVMNARQVAFIDVQITQRTHHVIILIKNSKEAENRKVSREGIGLVNIQKQLAFLYEDRYRLHIEECADTFTVHLTLPNYVADSVPYRG